jgi:hypothetical protein
MVQAGTGFADFGEADPHCQERSELARRGMMLTSNSAGQKRLPGWA